MAKQKVLVTGGSGFLGSHTADALTRAGYAVRIFDRVHSPYLQAGQEMVIGDITDTGALEKAMHGCACVYHLAGIADIDEAKASPVDTCQANIMGTAFALEAAKKAGIKRFVFASTIYVYSDKGGFYRVSKQACENLVEAYQETMGLDYTILRYGSLYGRRAGPSNGIYRLIDAALESGKITYNGHPEAMREYIHVADAARLSVDILSHEYINSHVVLTGNERLRVADLMRMISEMLPHKPKIEFGAQEQEAHYVMTPYTYSPRLGRKLVCNSHIDLGQGILDCIEDLSEQTRAKKQSRG